VRDDVRYEEGWYRRDDPPRRGRPDDWRDEYRPVRERDDRAPRWEHSAGDEWRDVVDQEARERERLRADVWHQEPGHRGGFWGWLWRR
jgi:hypothetical protein